jgi:hypothetical protein
MLFIGVLDRSQDSVVGIATAYELDDRRVKNFLFYTSSNAALGPTQPSIQWISGDISQR